ncbi:MAG TPA: hypothetical protein VGL99_19650 [Chloroflexota bacterium]|jgi:hypothetical protein
MSQAGWRGLVPERIVGPDGATAFVDACGFCTAGPVPGLDLPNLAEALNTTAFGVWYSAWGWKDDLHFDRRLYYARLVRGQPTFVSVDYLPDFIAALGGRGLEIERDPDRLYPLGRLSREAFIMYQFIAEHPALPSRELRSRTGLRNAGPAAERALLELQRRFLICKVDLTGRTRGTYSYVWDLAERFWPSAFEEARGTLPSVARGRIRERLQAFGITSTPALEARLFLWPALAATR